MAQNVTVVLTDDIDGSEATETVRFGLDGVWYEIDLNPGNAEKLREVFGEWTRHSRRTGAAPSRSAAAGGSGRGSRKRESNPDNTVIRQWAAANGHQVESFGRIPEEVRALYEAWQRSSAR
jgi:hypothetical protein